MSARVSHGKVQETQSKLSDVFMENYHNHISLLHIYAIQLLMLFVSKCLNCCICQDAIKSLSKEGRRLLLSLESSGKEDDAQWDVRMDWETVQR